MLYISIFLLCYIFISLDIDIFWFAEKTEILLFMFFFFQYFLIGFGVYKRNKKFCILIKFCPHHDKLLSNFDKYSASYINNFFQLFDIIKLLVSFFGYNFSIIGIFFTGNFNYKFFKKEK